MAFWLASKHNGQSSSFIQRFDPRFWTVNFPRPMMASVTLTAPDALQVDCEFYTKGDLAGLIWESEDRLDHPLLAYETHRDYSRTRRRTPTLFCPSLSLQAVGRCPASRSIQPILTGCLSRW